MSNDSFTRDDLISIRKNMKTDNRRGKYGYGGDTEQKKYKKMPDKDGLTLEKRQSVEMAKERLTYGESEGDLWQ